MSSMNDILSWLEQNAGTHCTTGNVATECTQSFKKHVSKCYVHRLFSDDRKAVWNINSSNVVRNYLWRELKYKSWEGLPYSISIFAEIDPASATRSTQIRVCLEFNEKRGTLEQKIHFNKYVLDMMNCTNGFEFIGERMDSPSNVVLHPQSFYTVLENSGSVRLGSGNSFDHICPAVIINQDRSKADYYYENRIREAVKNLEMYYLNLKPPVNIVPDESCAELELLSIVEDLYETDNKPKEIMSAIWELTDTELHMRNDITLKISGKLKEVFPVDKSFRELAQELDTEIKSLKGLLKEDRSVDTEHCFSGLIDELVNLKLKIQGIDEIEDISQAKVIEDQVENILNNHFNEDCIRWLREWFGDVIVSVENTLKDIQKKVTFRSGEYCHISKTITMFRLVLGRDPIKWYTTFAHELFHAYHFEKCKDVVWCSESHVKSIVLESLAKYFEHYYNNNYLNHMGGINNGYVDPFAMYEDPYKGEMHIKNDDDFRAIYKKSDDNVNKAFEEIVRLKNRW